MSELKKCPNCQTEVSELVPLNEGARKVFTELLGVSGLDAVCKTCYGPFETKIKAQANKEARRSAKEASRLSLWRRRVDIMRDARDRLTLKDYSGAVVSYEKYLRVVEMIYDAKPNKLEVGFFNNPARAKEIVLLASTYWDLVRIYDQSDRFLKRLQECADKLVEFLPFTPIYSEILHRIDDYSKTAKHRDVFQKISKQSRKRKKRCFIATAAFESHDSPTVQILCNYRDHILEKSTAGSVFVNFYYLVSPLPARILDHSPALRSLARTTLTYFANKLDEKYNLKTKDP